MQPPDRGVPVQHAATARQAAFVFLLRRDDGSRKLQVVARRGFTRYRTHRRRFRHYLRSQLLFWITAFKRIYRHFPDGESKPTHLTDLATSPAETTDSGLLADGPRRSSQPRPTRHCPGTLRSHTRVGFCARVRHDRSPLPARSQYSSGCV